MADGKSSEGGFCRDRTAAAAADDNDAGICKKGDSYVRFCVCKSLSVWLFVVQDIRRGVCLSEREVEREGEALKADRIGSWLIDGWSDGWMDRSME